MIVTIAVIGFAFVIALLFRQRPVWWLTVALGALIFVPRVATREIFAGMGDLGNIHPSTWLFLAGATVTVLSEKLPAEYPAGRRRLTRAITLWLVVALAIATVGSGGSAFAILATLGAPLVAFFAINSTVSRGGASVWRQLVNVIVAIGALEAMLAILQRLTGSVLFFESYYATQYWWSSDSDRAIGTLDSPLDLAALLTMCIPLLAAVRRGSTAVLIAPLLVIGVLTTGSRTGIILAVIATVLLLLARSQNLIIGTLVGVIMSVATLVFLLSPLATTLLDRFGTRGELSTVVREDALGLGLRLVGDEIWIGHGFGFAYQYSTNYLLSSFENAYLSLAIDTGLVLACALVIIQIISVFTTQGGRFSYRVPGLFAIVWGFTFSSFLSSSAFGTLAWVFIAIASLGALGPRKSASGAAYGSVRKASVVQP